MCKHLKAMLMAVFYNVGISFALAFAPAKTKEVYSIFYTSFLELF
jgi:hypothetical protein